MAIATLAVGLCLPAEAQETSAASPGRWTLGLTPYLWFASLEGDAAALPGLPPVAVDADFGDIIENTDIALMLVAEARRGRFGIVADLSYLSLSADGDTPGPLFGGAEVEVDTIFATMAGVYQTLAHERVSLDALAGGRAWYVDTEVDLGTGLLPARSFQGDEVWVDPVVGLRWNAQLGRGFFLTGYADVGGFGLASDLTWQLLGTLGYRFSDWFSARAGYRHLDVAYDKDGFVWDVKLSGPIVGAAFRF